MSDANPSDDDTDLIRAFPEAFEPYRMAIRIAELEAQIARLTAPITPDEAVAFTHDRLFTTAGGGGNMGALTAFLERRVTDPAASAGGFSLPHHATART